MGIIGKMANKDFGTKQRDYKCMNCGKLIEAPDGGPDQRRFCSASCKEKYFAPPL